MSNHFRLTVGSTKTKVLRPVDHRDVNESLAAATRARMVVEAERGATTPLLDLQTGGSGLTINTADDTISVDLSTAQANALTPGLFIATLNIEFGAGVWFESDTFYVKVRESTSEPLP